MKKYLTGFGVVLLVSIFLTCLKEKHIQGSSPSWEIAAIYRLIGWPEGVTVWALFLTLMAIAEQTQETAKAAIATEEAVIIANKSLELQGETVRRQLRAYVGTDAMEVRFSDGQPIAFVRFRNTGQTPAYEVQGWIGMEIQHYPLNVILATPLNVGISHPKQTLGSDGMTEYEVGLGRTLLNEDLRVLAKQNQNMTLFVYGQLRYKDTFGDSWHTNYRLIAGGPAGARLIVTQTGEKGWGLSPDVDGNDAT